MTRSRIRLVIVLMAPAVLMALVVMVVTVALLVSHEPWADARTGIAQVGDDLQWWSWPKKGPSTGSSIPVCWRLLWP